MKRKVTMASKISADWPGRILHHQDFAAALAARREATGNPEMPRNSGSRRTPGKRVLLKAIEDSGGKW